MQQNERWQEILTATASRQSFMDKLSASAAAGYRLQGGEIFCAKGCSRCCTLAVNCTAAEALLVARALNGVQQNSLAGYIERLKANLAGLSDLKEYLQMHRQSLGGCPFLADSCCGVYAARPISCRALLATRESRWCGVDFSSLEPGEKQTFLDSLDRFVTAFPLHYFAATQAAGQELEMQAAMLLLKEVGFSIYGSMPVLVYLFSDCDLLESFAKGAEAVLELAAAAGLDSPFLFQVENL